MTPVERDARESRFKVHPWLVQIAWPVLIFIASLVAGYYRGQAELGTRVSVLEEQTKTLRENVSDIKLDVKELLRRLR